MSSSDKSALNNTSRPLQHITSSLRNARHQSVRLWVDMYYNRQEKNERRTQKARNESARAKRAAKRAAPALQIDEEGRKRLKILSLAVRGRRGDKLLEQLVGREEEITEFWMATRLAALEARSRAPMDAEVAALFESRTGIPCNKNKARTRRKLLAALEKHPWVWRNFVTRDRDAISLPRDPV